MVWDQLSAVDAELLAAAEDGPTVSKTGGVKDWAGAMTAIMPEVKVEVRVLVKVMVTAEPEVGALVVSAVAIWDWDAAVVLVWIAEPPEIDQVFAADVVPWVTRPAAIARHPVLGTMVPELGAIVAAEVPENTPLMVRVGVPLVSEKS